jgi:hypothetical protein
MGGGNRKFSTYCLTAGVCNYNEKFGLKEEITVISCILQCPTTWYLAYTFISIWFQWTEN